MSDIKVKIVTPPAVRIKFVQKGVPGVGVPTGGDDGQVLAKSSDTDFDTEWVDISGGGTVDSVNGQTGIVVLDQDDIADGTTYKQYSQTEKTKLGTIASGAEVNVNADWNAISGDAQILNKPTIPSIANLFNKTTDDTDDITEGTTNKFISATQKTDLTDGGDSTLHFHAADRARANHTGTQTASTISNFDAASDARIANAAGVSVAPLVSGSIPAQYIPNYYDDVLEYANLAAFPVPGDTGKIYVALDTNLTYRWSGSIYAPLDPSLALGETITTAYRGDRGKIAYDHSQTVTGNPHNVTATQVGLGNASNTSDANKPVSTAQQTALDLKMDKSANLGDVANTATSFGNIKQAASDTATGVVELATLAEVNTGSDTTRVITPDTARTSYLGLRSLSIYAIEVTTLLTVSDGKAYFRVPPALNGMDFVGAAIAVAVPSSSGLPTVQISRGRQSTPTTAHAYVSVYSTPLTIDATEYDSKDATTPGVINTANDDVLTGDLLRIDVTVAGTGTKGLNVTLSFRKP
jgi:hypothetical protein